MKVPRLFLKQVTFIGLARIQFSSLQFFFQQNAKKLNRYVGKYLPFLFLKKSCNSILFPNKSLIGFFPNKSLVLFFFINKSLVCTLIGTRLLFTSKLTHRDEKTMKESALAFYFYSKAKEIT